MTKKFVKFLGKFKTHWLGPYQIQQVIDEGAIQLSKLNGELVPTLINGSRLKIYSDSHSTSKTQLRELDGAYVQCS